MSEYAVDFDCEKANDGPDVWVNHGRESLVNSCHHKTQDVDSSLNNRDTNAVYSGYCDTCDICEDSAMPMMNYAYPLQFEPSQNAILKIVKETNCTVFENTNTGSWFLVLCGGGMDLSQDIALAYIIAQRWLPTSLLTEVCTQPFLSTSEKNYFKISRAIRNQLKMERSRFLEKEKEWKRVTQKARFALKVKNQNSAVV